MRGTGSRKLLPPLSALGSKGGLVHRTLSGRVSAAVAVLTLFVTCGCATSPPNGSAAGSIRHVVIVVKENHSFDNYFGSLEAPQPALSHCPSLVSASRCQYNATDVPAYYEYAEQFGYADRYFTDVRGPSWPNDMMMTAAQSPLIVDPPQPLSTWVCP